MDSSAGQGTGENPVHGFRHLAKVSVAGSPLLLDRSMLTRVSFGWTHRRQAEGLGGSKKSVLGCPSVVPWFVF